MRFSKTKNSKTVRRLIPIAITMIAILVIFQGCTSTPKPKGSYYDGIGGSLEFSGNKVTLTSPNGVSTTMSFKLTGVKNGDGNYAFDSANSPFFVGWSYDAQNNIVYAGGTYRPS